MPAPSSDISPESAKSTESRSKPHLERDKVLDAALALLNEVGFEGLTLRRLADRLNVKAAALYWYFENKQELLNHLAGRILSQELTLNQADMASLTWRQLLKTLSRNLCSALIRYRDGAMVIATADLSKVEYGFEGRRMVVAELLRKGLPETVIFTAIFTVVRYTIGYVFEEQSDPRSQKKGDTYMRPTAPSLQDEFPEAAGELIRLYQEMVADPRQQFEKGLEVVMDGIEKKLTA